MTVSHAADSNADAFDVSIENLIDLAANSLVFVPGTFTTEVAGGAVLTGNDTTGGDLSLSLSTIPVGATASFTFMAEILNSAPPFTPLVNAATAVFTSTPGDLTTPQSSNPLSTERTGSPTDPGAAANDHTAQDSGSVQTLAAAADKFVTGTSFAPTSTDQFDPTITDLVVGEVVTYTIQAVLPEGTTTLVVIDQLPTTAGVLELLTAEVLSTGANLTIQANAPTITVSDTNTDTLNDQAVFDFGSVLNTPDGISNAADIVELELTALVVDSPANTNGLVVTNEATIDFGTGQTIVTEDIEIVEPVLLLDKTSTPTSGPAGIVVSYEIVVSHDTLSTSDAFDVTISDLLTDANQTLIAGSVTTTAGDITTGNTAGDTTVAIDLDSIGLTESVAITFQALIDSTLPGGIAISNTGVVDFDSLQGPGGRAETSDDTAVFTTTEPEVDLQITKTDSNDPVVVGDAFEYTLLIVNAGPSTATNVIVTDTLPIEITSTGATASQGTASVTAGVLNASLGILDPGESATVTVLVTAPVDISPLDELVVNSTAEADSDETDIDLSNNTDDEPTTIVDTADLSGINFVDTNGDGVLNTGEIALPGVQLTLTGTDDLGQPVNLTTTSGLDGSFLFENLRPGEFTLTQTQPSLFADSTDFLGSVGGSIAGDNELLITLAPGDNATDNNFTEQSLALSKRPYLLSNLNASINALDSAFGSLADQDLDGNGVVDSDDFDLFAQTFGGVF